MSPRLSLSRRIPSLRWCLAKARLHVAYALALPTRELVSRGSALVAAVMLVIACVTYVGLQAPPPAAEGEIEVVRAWVNFLVQVGIMLVAALVSYAMRPKPKDPEVAKASVPVTEDGKSIRRIYGEVWIPDSIILGFKQTGTTPIKAKGGKK
jgi:hypothetical protein